MATYTRQVTDTLALTDTVVVHGAWERLAAAAVFVDGETGAARITTEFSFLDGEVGASRLTKLVVFVDAYTGLARTTQDFAQIDGQTGTPRVTEEFAAVDGAFGTPRVTEAFLTYDVASWAVREYTRVATDALDLWDANAWQKTVPVNWAFWGEADYYREVAALMRFDVFTPFRYPQGPLWETMGMTDWVVATKISPWTPPTPTFVQSTAYKYGNTSIVTVQLNDVQSGNLIVVFLGDYGTFTSSCYDTLGNSWTLVGSVYNGSLLYWDSAWVSFISNPGSMIISARHGGTYPTLHAFEFSGVNTLVQRTTLKSGGTTICATLTMDAAPGLIVTAINWGGNVTLTSMQPDAGFTHIRSIAQNNGPIGIGVAYRVTTVTGDYPSGWTIAPTNTPLGEFALAFKFVQV